MFKAIRHRRWLKKLQSKPAEQFQAEIENAAKSVLVKALVKGKLNPSDPEKQVLMTGAMFTVLAKHMEVPVDDLYAIMSTRADDFVAAKKTVDQEMEPLSRGYL